ncbi:hypothetical protein GWK26_12665 [haloarchaeon 3A1-DGR]|nr:hypothetical protein GWK26_12665 [haloarchaeon 3A1-DGR]
MERIPIPEDRAQEKRPIHLEFIPRSFPGQRFAVRFDWNDYAEQWTIELEHVRREYMITKSVATPFRPYSYLPYLVFVLADTAGEVESVTPQNLGDEVKLWVLPGPSGQPPEEQ